MGLGCDARDQCVCMVDGVCVCMVVGVCVRACVRVCVRRACVFACVRVDVVVVGWGRLGVGLEGIVGVGLGSKLKGRQGVAACR